MRPSTVARVAAECYAEVGRRSMACWPAPPLSFTDDSCGQVRALARAQSGRTNHFTDPGRARPAADKIAADEPRRREREHGGPRPTQGALIDAALGRRPLPVTRVSRSSRGFAAIAGGERAGRPARQRA